MAHSLFVCYSCPCQLVWFDQQDVKDLQTAETLLKSHIVQKKERIMGTKIVCTFIFAPALLTTRRAKLMQKRVTLPPSSSASLRFFGQRLFFVAWVFAKGICKFSFRARPTVGPARGVGSECNGAARRDRRTGEKKRWTGRASKSKVLSRTAGLPGCLLLNQFAKIWLP